LLNFCLLGWDNKELEWITFTIKELSYRMGFKFYITYSENEINSTDFTVVYSKKLYKKKIDYGFVLDVVYNEKAKYEYIKIDNENKVWGCSNNYKIDILKGSYYLLSLEAEQQLSSEYYDKFNRIRPETHPMKDYFLIPLLDLNANYLAKMIKEKNYQGEQYKFLDKYDFAVIMTHDVDGPSLVNGFALFRSFVLGFLKNNKKERESLYFGLLSAYFKESDPYWNFEDWILLEKTLNMKSTYFFYYPILNRHIKDPKYTFSNKVVSIVKKLEDNGMEIGLHSGINLNTDKDYSMARNQMSNYTKESIVGHRAHYWNINWQNSFESWEQLYKAGFKYDLSVNPMTLGYRNFSMFPIDVLNNGSFFTLATAIMDGYCIDEKDIHYKVDKILQDIISFNGILVLDWHVRTLFNKGAFSNFLDVLFVLINKFKNYNVKYFTAKEAINDWKQYTKKLYQG